MLLRQLWVPPVTQYDQGAGASLPLAERVLAEVVEHSVVCWELGARSWRRWALPLLVCRHSHRCCSIRPPECGHHIRSGCMHS